MVNVDQYEGQVTRIGMRSLIVRTWDRKDVIIPNSAVVSQPFTNWTRGDDLLRLVLTIGVSYDDAPRRAAGLIEGVLRAHPAVLADPPFKMLLWEFADSAVNLRVQFHLHLKGPVGQLDTRSQVLFGIWDAFKAAGITIHYPQHDAGAPSATYICARPPRWASQWRLTHSPRHRPCPA